jgi:hypothetical protein
MPHPLIGFIVGPKAYSLVCLSLLSFVSPSWWLMQRWVLAPLQAAALPGSQATAASLTPTEWAQMMLYLSQSPTMAQELLPVLLLIALVSLTYLSAASWLSLRLGAALHRSLAKRWPVAQVAPQPSA